jgi:hypothetical protein
VVANSYGRGVEAPASNVLTVNGGVRQLGRVLGQTVLDVPAQSEAMWEVIETPFHMGVPPTMVSRHRRYGPGGGAPSIVRALSSSDLDALRAKLFDDLDFEPDAHEACERRTPR